MTGTKIVAMEGMTIDRSERLGPVLSTNAESDLDGFRNSKGVAMLITFSTQASANISMFREDAMHMLSLMGVTEMVPGSILSSDVPVALSRLKRAVEAEQGFYSPTAEDVGGIRPATRAQPLIRLLSDAEREGKNVLWDTASVFD